MQAKKKSGDFFIQMSFLSMCVLLVLLSLFLGVILSNGLRAFWASDLTLFEMKNGEFYLGEKVQEKKKHTGEMKLQIKIANRDLYGEDFKWVFEKNIKSMTKPKRAFVAERKHGGNLFAYLSKDKIKESEVNLLWKKFDDKNQQIKKGYPEYEKLKADVLEVTKEINEMKKLRKKLVYYERSDTEIEKCDEALAILKIKSDQRDHLAIEKFSKLEEVYSTVWDANGREITITHTDVVRSYRPNSMGLFDKISLYTEKVVELLTSDPRESNTEGGLFPTIFGTVILVFMMSVASFPLGVIAGIYMKEYAKDGPVVRIVRIAVNNLAGIPSIVFGIFGLGFFIYGIGGEIDKMFFPEMLPEPTFGTGGLFWASLTLGLLTVPIVIVATEEALGVIPGGLREAATALGANKFQILYKVLLPMASPGIMTGFILAMSRAAGEVAPLMITGVVKSAPDLLLTTEAPFLHLDRKFMHLGFHIFDVGFQSPNVEAAMPMVYVSTLLLLVIIITMCSFAIYLRSNMRKRFIGSHL